MAVFGKKTESQRSTGKPGGFGTAAVFLTSISSVLGAILFLRLGFATGTLGFWGVIAIIVLGHMITIPTALALSELATNTRVEGGGEYFIISRSFGLKIGSTIGITLFLSQTISIAFYTIAFAEAFGPLFEWFHGYAGFELPRQVVSVPTLLLMAYVILTKGAGSGIKLLYAVNAILFASLVLFFLGHQVEPVEQVLEVLEDGTVIMGIAEGAGTPGDAYGFFNGNMFFVLFAICFPAFTGMTAGVGLSGDLRDPGKSIPLGTILGTLTGFVVYILVVWKLTVSASRADLIGDQLIMSRIALFGSVIIPLGLAACTSSSALGAMMVAPRTLQAICGDRVFPFPRINLFMARGRGESREPRNASVVSYAIALVFILMGNVDSVAEIISMFFLITYGTLCLSSFLNHFGSPPSYRPKFKSRWYLSLAGFILSVWVMFKINSLYTVVSYMIIVVVYIFIEKNNKHRKGIVNIFKGALFQLNRSVQVYMQKHQSSMEKEEWRPAVICVSSHSFERQKVLDLMKWLSHKHGFGTYFHYIEDYFSKQTYAQSREVLAKLVQAEHEKGSLLYMDTMISPSYTSAIAQVIQTPSISGMENNLVIFEYDKNCPHELERIADNVNLVKAGNFDVGIFAMSDRPMKTSGGIHVWIRDTDEVNTNFMILLGYIILSHQDWKKSHIKIFLTSTRGGLTGLKRELQQRIAAGRLPITMTNIEIVVVPETFKLSEVISGRSRNAALTLIGFNDSIVKHDPVRFFYEFEGLGDILFVNTSQVKEIK